MRLHLPVYAESHRSGPGSRAASALPVLETLDKGMAVSSGWEGIDIRRAKRLIERSFRKQLVPGYFLIDVEKVFIKGDYDGIAVARRVCGSPYLDKLAVAPEAKGTGAGKALLDSVIASYPRLFWRAKMENPINPWYMRCSDGHFEKDGWFLYWKGMGREMAESLGRVAISLPETFVKKPANDEENVKGCIISNDNHAAQGPALKGTTK
jgi:acetylglutamate synthase